MVGLRFTGLPTSSDFLLSAATLTLRGSGVLAAQVPAQITVYARNTPAPSAYSTANPPPLLSELTALSDSLVASTTVTSTGTVVTALSLSLPALNTARAFGGGSFTGLALHVHVRTADGSQYVFEDSDIGGVDPVLNVTTDTRTHTGMEIPHGELPHSVPDACPVCGEVTLRETWQWCGLHKRMECVHCVDPEDRREATIAPSFPYVGGRGSSPNA